MSDRRKAFIVNTIVAAIAPPEQKDAYAKAVGKDDNSAISNFMEDATYSILQASVSGLGTSKPQLKLSNKAEFAPTCQYQVILTKLKVGPLAESDIPTNVHVATISHSPASSLYHTLKDVFNPMLSVLNEATGAAAVDQRLQELLQQVQAGLGAAVRKGGAGGDYQQVTDPNTAPLTDILTPLDELNFWADLTNNPALAGQWIRAAQQVNASLEGLRQPFEDLLQDSLSGDHWEAAKEIIDQTVQAVREIWPIKVPPGEWAFGQKRATNFFRVVGAVLAAFVQTKLKGLNLWTDSFQELKGPLTGASHVMSRWRAEAEALIRDWKMGIETGGHEWEGGLDDPYVIAFQERLEEIYHMRETNDELGKLLSGDDSSLVAVKSVFGGFAHLAPLQVGEFTASVWKAAKEDYEHKMEPIENQISAKLKELFGSVFLPGLMASVGRQGGRGASGPVAQPQQVFIELKKYSGLLGRPIISAALQAEKEALAKQIDKHLENLQQDFDHRRDMASQTPEKEGQMAATGRNTCSVADHVMWCMQCQVRVQKTQEVLGLMLGPRPAEHEDPAMAALRSCLGVAKELDKEVEEFKKEQFKSWQEGIKERMDEMVEWKSSKLMTFDSQNSHVKTHFNDQLVILLREVRQLQALGFNIKKEILNEVEIAIKFYRYGMVLKQRANFYNNISTEMIQCQKPMMLKDALEFEKVLMNPKDNQGKDITWRSAAALDGYAKRLNEVADRLAEKNRQLRQWHQVLQEKVIGLMGTDLVRYKDKWVNGIKEMREVFGRLESEGHSRDSQQVWRQHWDFQLYKALEYQYAQGLECINKNLPEIEIKMVFRQHKLQYEPPLEELRIKHYKDYLNTFLGLPLRMKGVSDLTERQGFFRPIVDNNPGGMAKVYAAAEALFIQLADELKKYQDWVVLGTVDLEEFIDANLHEVSDWDLNFRMLKAAAKDAEKLPNEIKVDCYKINMLSVKASMDEQMKKLQEGLVSSLRRKAVEEKKLVEEFMASGQSLFEIQATTVEDIGNAGYQAKTMVDGLTNIFQVRRRIDEKNKLLRQMAGSSNAAQFAMVDLTDVNNAWETFTTQLQQFDAHLAEQKVQLQQQIVRQVDDFKSKLVGFQSRWSELKPKGGPSGNPVIVLNRIDEFNSQMEELRAEADKYLKECDAFKIEMPDFTIMDEVQADIAATKVHWDRYGDFLKERDELANKDWLSMRDQVWKIEDFLAKWMKNTEGKPADDAIALILLNEIDAYRRCLPYLRTSMRGAGWEEEHWMQLFTMLNMRTSGPGAVTKETVTLAHFLDKADNIIANAEKIKHLDAQAQGEAMLRKAINELKIWGLQREFTFSEASSTQVGAAANAKTKGKRTPLIKEWRDIMTEVGDHQSLVASLKQSPFYVLFKDEVFSWENKLGFLQEGLTTLNSIQRKWVYLEPIFARGALPQQQAKFWKVDEDFRRVMLELEVSKKVVSFAEIAGIRDKMPQMAQLLDVCQRALADFLEEKRSLFPRFYFIGDDDLLEILGQCKNPTVIQSHLKKLFAGIHKVKFTPNSSAIVAMLSMEGEVVDLADQVQVTDSIEGWLNDLQKQMRNTLMVQQENVRRGNMPDEFKTAASQVVCLKEACKWTEKCEEALRSNGGLQRYLAELRDQLSKLTASDYTGHTLLQLKKQSLIMDFMHYLDVVEYLIKEQAGSSAEWPWIRQLRYYPKGDGAVVVKMAEGVFDYTWEYQGNASKLVYTPLTDKCYLTLTQGMALGYGGNPYGPAGTGKTESVKALGQAMARQVLVFNCDEEFDFKSMGRIFVGLVKCGAWGCFDEFNRLDEEVLSAVSQQIQQIQGALKEGTKSMQFMDKTVEVNKNAGIFVTLNPAGKGYGGRSKLPDNLKQLFRSIAMTVPDNDLIAEVLLLSEGFASAKVLARKLVTLFQLSRELLSPQQHYDWGLRALKTCLGVAGKELREVRKAEKGATLDAVKEMEIIIRSICAIKLPTLTFDDNKRFRDLLADLFPGAKITDTRNADLEKAIATVAKAENLELTGEQVEKMLQLHLACEQRIGIIIVGPSGSGKSTLWEVLDKAYDKLGKKPVVYKMNPKAMPRQQLLGSMNMDTREWSDGVLTAAARKVVKESLEQRSWIICDGDVDPEWIESLNSVLDDNKLLTMPNGERIQFANNINFIFECHSLEFASPATVSRCGMIFMSDENMDLNRMIKRWLKSHSDVAGDPAQMELWFKDHFYKAFNWALSHPKAVETTKVGLLENCLSHLATGCSTKRDFVCALARGLGGNMTVDMRRDFLNDLGRMAGEVNLYEVAYPQDPLSLMLGEDLRELSPGEQQTLVLTDDAGQNLMLLAPWLKNQEPFILVGPEGCGKSTMLEYCFNRLKDVQVAVVNCSAQTSAANVIQKLVQMCGKPAVTNTGKALRPPDKTRMILYLKDLNLPRPDKYNTSQMIAFLQQLLTHRGYYDENLEFINIERIQIIGSMNPASTVGRHALSTRFTARCRVAYITYPEKENLQTIFSSMITTRIMGENSGNNSSATSPSNLARAMLDVYHQVLENFPATDQPHYLFTPRNVTEWITCLQNYDLSNMDLLEAVAYEAMRIFRDRLVGDHVQTFDSFLSNVLRSQLSYRGEFNTLICSTLGAGTEDRLSGDPKRCPLIKWAPDEFSELVADKLKGFEREFKELNMLLFPEILERIAHIDRVLAQPGGSLLLCGASGVGRRTCILLMAYSHHMTYISPKMTKNYDMKAFRNDLKEVMKKAGVEGKPVLFFMEDHNFIDPAIIEYLNSLLSGGEVPGLFTTEELNKELLPLEHLRNTDQNYNGPTSLYAYFTWRIQHNLHIAISMDPSNELFRIRCESNPALITRCAVQWLDTWTMKGMEFVPAVRLKDVMAMSNRDYDKNLVDHMLNIHTGMGAEFTPRHFTAFVDLYAKTFTNKRTQVVDQINFLKGGLDKLAEAEVTVDSLTIDAEKQRKLLKVKQAEAEDALTKIQASMEQAAGRRKEVEMLRIKVSKEEKEMQVRRSSVEVELADVQPLIDQARKAVGQIKADNINEIRSLKMPPDAIRDVLEGVLQLMGQEDTSWNNMKKFLGQRAVKEDIINYDAHRVTPQIRAKVEKLLAAKANSFEQATIYRVSVAAAPMAAWVKANLAFSKVLEKVSPLEAELEGLKASLEESTRLVSQYEEELKVLDKQVVELKDHFGKKTGEAETLRMKLEQAEGILNAAKTLLERLGGEKKRWVQQMKSLDKDMLQLPLNTLITTAFLTYLPMLDETQRAKVQADWQKKLGLETYDVRQFMSSESEGLKWKSEGLPADDLSMQNGIVILNSKLAPLIIDPSTQASEWLKLHMKGASTVPCEVTTMYDQRFTTTLELSVRFGKTLIIQEVDKIEPILYPLLRMDLDRQGPRFVVQVGDKAIDYNETFRLFLVTRNPNPYLPPDAKSLLTVTNFTVTKSGLEGQLLGLTIQKEQPELEAQKSGLLRQEEENKMQVAELEKVLLRSLATSKGNILDNKELLDSLNETKQKSSSIAESLVESKKLQESLDKQREVYRPIAQRGSVMYFLISDLKAINHMYQFSLASFLNLFKNALNKDTPPGNVTARIAVLSDTLLELVFATVSRSLFNLDRLTFGMYMARHLQAALVKQEEWNFFLGKQMVDGAQAAASKPAWVREEIAAGYGSFVASFPQMAQVCEFGDAGMWAPWMSSPEAAAPPRLANKLNAMQQLLLVKTFRPDRLQSAMSKFICTVLNIKSVAPPPFSLKQMVETETSADEPILFITTPGADPSQEIAEYADETIGKEKFHEVAMGQGQAEIALNLLRECGRSGEWLLLKNIHLVVSWLPTLEKEVYGMNKHKDFRLFMTSEPHNKFPSTLLEISLKVTFEAPPGLKKNMQRTYENWSNDFIKAGGPLRAQLLFVLAWFHAVVQERRNYIPQGWSKFYEFSSADLRSGGDIIQLGTREGKVQWAFLHGLLENAIYGGRVDNKSDANVLRTYLHQYFNPSMLGMDGKTKALPGSRVSLPTTALRQDYVGVINSLPDVDTPALFSLPANIDRSAQQVNSGRVIASLRQMSISTDAMRGFNRKKWTQQLAPLLKLWEQLMTSSPALKQVAKDIKARGKLDDTSPLTNFVALERLHGCQLIGAIDRTLGSIARLLRGTDPLTSTVQAVGAALMADTVPGSWDKIWEGPESPLDYCRAVVAKANSVEGWWSKCTGGTLLSGGPLDLANLFHPATFLNALAQQTARQIKQPIDNLKLVTSWDGNKLGGDKGAVVVQLGGLLLQGAAFDGQRVTALAADAATSRVVPPMFTAWIPKDAPFPYSSYMSTPIYTNTDRTKVLTEVQMPVSSEDESKTWILAGVAMFLSS